MKNLVYDNPVDNAEELVPGIAVAAGEIRHVSVVFQNVQISMRGVRLRRCALLQIEESSNS